MSYRADKQVITAHTDGRTDGHTDRRRQRQYPRPKVASGKKKKKKLVMWDSKPTSGPYKAGHAWNEWYVFVPLFWPNVSLPDKEMFANMNELLKQPWNQHRCTRMDWDMIAKPDHRQHDMLLVTWSQAPATLLSYAPNIVHYIIKLLSLAAQGVIICNTVLAKIVVSHFQ